MRTTFVLACDDNFVAYTSIVAKRIADLSSERVTIIVISDGVSDRNKKLAQQFCPSIGFIEASTSEDLGRLRGGQLLPRSSCLRLLLDEILVDFDHAVYLDSDITPLVDIAPLLSLVPRKSPVIAAYDLPMTRRPETYERLSFAPGVPYLQSGILILDLKSIRTERIFRDTMDFMATYPEKCFFQDQDALNAVLKGRWQVMDWRWNVLSTDAEIQPGGFRIRYHGGLKPWAADKGYCEKPIVEFWRNAISESPWPEKYAPPNRPSAKEIRRQLTRPVVDFLGLTSKNRIARKNARAAYFANVQKYRATIDRLSSDGALATSLG